jgi:hypothetical protein
MNNYYENAILNILSEISLLSTKFLKQIAEIINMELKKREPEDKIPSKSFGART